MCQLILGHIETGEALWQHFTVTVVMEMCSAVARGNKNLRKYVAWTIPSVEKSKVVADELIHSTAFRSNGRKLVEEEALCCSTRVSTPQFLMLAHKWFAGGRQLHTILQWRFL